MPIGEEVVLGTRFPLTVRETPRRGRCLVTLAAIPKGATIEVAPVQVLPAELASAINAYGLDYFVLWENPNAEKTLAMPLGLVGLCNYSNRPSAQLVPEFQLRLIHLVAMRKLDRGAEITVKYRDPARSYSARRHIK
jgi:hypothetical protein